MLGKNLLWVAKQHGHSVEVMLRMYAAWIEGATDADILAIKQAMDASPSAHALAATNAARTATHRAKKIVINPLLSPEFGSRLAVEKSGTKLSTGKDLEKKWRRGWDCSRPGTAARPPLRSGPPRAGALKGHQGVSRQHRHNVTTMWRTYASWMVGIWLAPSDFKARKLKLTFLIGARISPKSRGVWIQRALASRFL
jgi:hypothetical protein